MFGAGEIAPAFIALDEEGAARSFDDVSPEPVTLQALARRAHGIHRNGSIAP